MDFYNRSKPVNGKRYGIGFRSKRQLPLVMIWKEYWRGGEVVHADVIFSTR